MSDKGSSSSSTTKKRSRKPKIGWLKPPLVLALSVFVLITATAMGALAFLQFSDWDVPFYIFASIPLPVATAFLIGKVIVPALNRSRSDDSSVTIPAFFIYYFSMIIGWAMIWMIIWHVKPDSYHGIDTFNPKDAYNVFGYVLVGATFVCFRTAPTFVLPEALISCLVSEIQIVVGFLVEVFFIAFLMRIIFVHFKAYQMIRDEEDE